MHGKGRKLQQNLMARLEDIDDGIKLKWDKTELKGGFEENNANEYVSVLILDAFTICISSLQKNIIWLNSCHFVR